ncbi:hypothetical protein Aperf_G00000020176 [Anoplocephala perfoliata]
MDSLKRDLVKEVRQVSNNSDDAAVERTSTEILQLFFTPLPPNKILKTYSNLNELIIIGQPIKNLSFLKNCPKIAKLWVCECGLESMQAVRNAECLQELVLFDNKLKRIEGLESMTTLRRLWLNVNDISTLSGIEKLSSLENLNLAGNKIARLNNSLESLLGLGTLNISGNLWYDLQDMFSLALLPKISSLAINDPEFAPSAIALQPCSSLALAYQIPQLDIIDGICLNRPFTSILHSITCEKKLFFYSKFRHRHNQLLNKQRRLNNMLQCLSKCFVDRLRVFDIKTRSMESYSKRDLGSPKAFSMEIKALKKSLEEIRARMCYWKNRLHETESAFECALSGLSSSSKLNRCLHTVELQLFGCLSIDPVNQSSELFSLCRRFCQMRLCWHEKWLERFSEMRLNNLWHIRNFLLQECYHPITSKGDDLLFYNGIFSNDADFCHLGEYLRSGFPNDKIAEHLSFTTLLNKLLNFDKISTEHACNISFIVLVVRAFMKEEDNYYRTGIILPTNFNFTASGKRSFCACSLAHFEYAFNNPKGLVPEFIAELELISNSKLSKLLLTLNKKNSLLMSSSPGSLNEFLSSDELNRDNEVLISVPNLPSPPHLSKYDISAALRNPWFCSLCFTKLDLITELNLYGTEFRSLHSLNMLPSLTSLGLSNCALTNLKDLSLNFLENLDVSHNSLSTLEDLSYCPSLRSLNTNWNLLTNLEREVKHLFRIAAKLIDIKLEHNPWFRCRRPNECAQRLFSLLSSNLRSRELDFSDGKEIFQQNHVFSTSRICMLTLWPVVSTFDRNLLESVPTLDSFMGSTQLWTHPFFCPTWVFLSLRALFINDAHLTELNTLSSLEQLEELSVEGNSLTSLQAIGKFVHLITLLVGDNFIKTISNCGIGGLKKLKVLALDDNEISALTPLKRCSSLQQIYVSGNKITDYSSVLALNGLADLKVLDMRFNPLKSKMSRYRLRTLYHLPHLSFLDGEAVTLKELNEAKEALEGRLSTELLLASLGIDTPTRLAHFDFEDSGIRTVELSPPGAFLNLHTVNLQNNRLSSFDGLLDLENLKVLWLAGNKISSLCSALPIRDSQLTFLPKLTVLSLERNEISSLNCLHLNQIPSIRTLFLQDNALTAMSGLAGMINLRYLVLDRNRIRKTFPSDLINLHGLLELHLDDNRLREIQSVEYLEELEHLYLKGNRLENLESVLDSLKTLKKLSHLGLCENPLSKAPPYRLVICRQLQNLRSLDGIKFTALEIQMAADLFEEVDDQAPVTVGLENNHVLFSSVDKQKRVTKSLWQNLTSAHIDLIPASELAKFLTTEAKMQQTGLDVASIMTSASGGSVTFQSTVCRRNLPKESPAEAKEKSKIALKATNNRMVMSIPGISINAMAQFESQVPHFSKEGSVDDSAAANL